MRTPSALWFQLKLHWPLILWVGLILLLAAILAVGGLFVLRGCGFASETVTTGGVLLEGASPTDSYLPFGSRLLRFNGQTLFCIDKNGETVWDYALSDAAEYTLSASSTRAALYSGSNLILLDEKGDAVFSGRMDGTITRVRLGETSAAVEIEGAPSLLALNRNGETLDEIDVSASTLVDFGFYSSNDLLWTLSINRSGLSPSSRLDIYKPGKELVSSYMTDTQFYYKPLFYQDDVYILGTEALDLASASGVSYSAYGWQYADSAVQDDGLTVALTLSGQSDSTQVVRVFRQGELKDMHLPVGCFDLYCGPKGLYGVSAQALYLMPYDGGASQSFAFRGQVSQALCVFSGYMAVSTSDGQVRLMKLP